MAIVKMKRLTVLAMDTDEEKLLDALVRCQSVQLKRTAKLDGGADTDNSVARENLSVKVNRAEEYIGLVSDAAQAFNSQHKHSKDERVTVPKNTLARPKTEIDFDYFLNFGSFVEQTERTLDEAARLHGQIDAYKAQIAQKQTYLDKLSFYAQLPHPTSWYRDTDETRVRLSQIPTSELAALQSLVEICQTVDYEVIDSSTQMSLLAVVSHKSQTEFWEKASALGLAECAMNIEILPRAAIENVRREIAALQNEIDLSSKRFAQYAEQLPQWKVYVDYLHLCDSKLAADGDLQKTNRTFVLEAYYPADTEQRVTEAVRSVSADAIIAYDEIGETEFAPTLVRNNKAVKRFEVITNMYTPPQYHEIDPNPVMSIFYFVIFGLMMADIGYGLLLVVAGLAASVLIKQPSGIKNLLQLFGICGISAIAVGALFGSFFSYQLYPGVIPSPAEYPMVMMVISLMLGVVHIMAGVGCKMAVKIKNGHKLSAWLADFPWIIVLTSFLLAIFNMAIDMMNYPPYNVLKLPDPVTSVALYVCLGALAVALIFAGVDAKGLFGKLAKSFGSAYGIINYFSDVMSYIRIFGLLLSSALVGSVVNQLGDMVMANGGAGYVGAAIILIFAHMFNLVMGLMSIYIHNGRLQYVEFFGKFYEGDGQLFVPFGSDTKYTLLKN